MAYDLNKFPWHLRKIGLPGLWEKLGNRGEGIKIGIIDSGIYRDHPEFSGARIEAGGFLDAPADIDDVNGHGTHCAGLLVAQGERIFGVCPEASLYVAKVYNSEDELTLERMAKAIHWLVETKGVNVISASVYHKLEDETHPYFDILKAEVENAENKGVKIFSTIGNFSNAFPITSYPASFDSIISVGASNEPGRIFINTPVYSKLDIIAPGEQVELLNNSLSNPYRTDSGTSFAVPLVAGITSLLMNALSSNAGMAYEYLINNLQDTITSNRNNKSFSLLSKNLHLPNT